MSKERVLTLEHPFSFGDREVKEVTFRRLKGKHLKKLGASPTMVDLLELASKSAGEPPALFEEMDAEDVIAATEIIGDFLGGIRPGGATT